MSCIHRGFDASGVCQQMILLETAETQKKQAEKKQEEMGQRLREAEKQLEQAKKENSQYQVRQMCQNESEREEYQAILALHYGLLCLLT